MKPFRQTRFALVLLAAVVAGLGTQGSAAAQREDHKGSATARGDAPDVTLMLAGTYRMKNDDGDLQLQITSNGGTERSGTLLATLSGRYQGTTLHHQGVLHVDNQGSQVLLTVTPQFPEGPESAAKSPHQLSATEIRAACSIYLSPAGAGWTGTTQDPGNCVKALALNRDVGQWQLRLRPDELQVMDATSKQSLVFQKVSGSGRGSS
jgi:hypothetical protein